MNRRSIGVSFLAELLEFGGQESHSGAYFRGFVFTVEEVQLDVFVVDVLAGLLTMLPEGHWCLSFGVGLWKGAFGKMQRRIAAHIHRSGGRSVVRLRMVASTKPHERTQRNTSG